MSAAEALKAARAAGIELRIDGDALTLEAASAPPPALLDQLSRYKAGLIALLRPAESGWSALDWLAFFNEQVRSAAANGVVHPETAARAFACCLVEMLDRNPAPSGPGRCAWCGKAESLDAVVLPFGTEPGTHTSLHSTCWPAWHTKRQSVAIAALAAMGIYPPRTHQ